MENELYDYSPIVEREAIHWPGDARVAFYVGLNAELRPDVDHRRPALPAERPRDAERAVHRAN